MSWDKAPEDEIEQYFIEMKEKGEVDYRPIGRVNGDASSFACDLLEYGVPYLFRVKGRNEAGYSQDVTMSNYVRVKEPSGIFVKYTKTFKFN